VPVTLELSTIGDQVQRFVKVVCAGGAAFAVSMSVCDVAHAAPGQVTIQVSGTDQVLAGVRVALFDGAGVDVAPAQCATDVRPGLLTLTCAGLDHGAYRAAVVAPTSGIAVTEFCSPADPSLDPEPDGSIRLRPEADVFICTKTVAAVQIASQPGVGVTATLPAMGGSWALAGLAMLLVAVGSGMSVAARRAVGRRRT